MGVSSGSQKRKAAYDPQRKWGLAPANGSAGSPSSSQVDAEGPTYVVAGHIVAGAAAGKHDMFLKEKVGREAQARAARKANSHDTDVTLKRLLARDKEGMRAVQEAHEFAKKTRKKRRTAGGKVVGKEDDIGDSVSESSGTDDEEDCESGDGSSADRPRPTTTTKNAYSARVIKELGFDPTSKSFRGGHGQRREGEDPQNKIYSEVLSVSSLSAAARGVHATQSFFFFITVSTA
jgi:minichromosome maintenance protein 10